MDDIRTLTGRTVASLDDIRGEWSELWERCPYATPFQGPEWLIPWWRAFHPGALRCLTLRRAGRLAGFAPLYVDESGRARLIGAGNTDYLDVLVEPDLDVQWIFEGAGRAEFQDLRPESPLLAGGRPAEPTTACPVLELPARVDDWRTSLPAGLKRNLRRYRERLEAKFETSADPCAIEHLFDLHAARWRRLRGEPGVLADARLRSFHREIAAGFAARGWLRFYIIRAGQELPPAAVNYVFACRGRAYFYLGGFDPAHAAASPGTLAIGYAIESFIREGMREAHFLRGAEAYKYAWGARDRWNVRVLID